MHTQGRVFLSADKMHFDVYVEQLLGDAFPWAQTCALFQPVSLGLADALRRKFIPSSRPNGSGASTPCPTPARQPPVCTFLTMCAVYCARLPGAPRGSGAGAGPALCAG